MSKVLPIKRGGKAIGYIIDCPACKCGHLFYTTYGGRPAWSFNGDLEKPTFVPSMLVHGNRMGQKRCHSLVYDGNIQYLSDSEHELAGQIVPLPEIDENYFSKSDEEDNEQQT